MSRLHTEIPWIDRAGREATSTRNLESKQRLTSSSTPKRTHKKTRDNLQRRRFRHRTGSRRYIQ